MGTDTGLPTVDPQEAPVVAARQRIQAIFSKNSEGPASLCAAFEKQFVVLTQLDEAQFMEVRKAIIQPPDAYYQLLLDWPPSCLIMKYVDGNLVHQRTELYNMQTNYMNAGYAVDDKDVPTILFLAII